jgi:hypothetical protein
MTVTPQRHAIYTTIMPVEELFIHLQTKLRLDGGGGLRVYSWASQWEIFRVERAAG